MRSGFPGLRRRARSAFSLIEILIVVIILGILAVIVVPQFTSASAQKRLSTTESVVQQVQQAIDLYRQQHGDKLPDLERDGLTCLAQPSVYKGTTFGPYLRTVPVNPMTNGSAVKNGTYAGNAAGVAGADFVYDYQSAAGTGTIWAAQNATGSALLGP